MAKPTRSNTVARIVHDLSLATWFGGSLMGAAGLNAASREVENPSDRSRVANAGWGRWTPINLAAIVGYGVSGAILTKANKGRLATQRGVKGISIAKTAVSAAAIGATGYARVLGEQIMREGATHVADAVTPSDKTPPEVAEPQRRLKFLQWAIPAHVAALIALSSRMGEQQRPMQVVRGILKQGLSKGKERLPRAS